MARNGAEQTTAAVEPATTIDPQPEAPAPPPPPSSSSSATTMSSDDPLDVEHYIPRLPLQLAAIAFALAAPVAAAAAAPGSRNSSAVPRPAQVLAAWIDAPRETLAFQSALVAVVQVWFGYWARSCRTGQGRNTKTPRTAREQVGRSRSAARRTAPKGFGAIMNHIWHNDIRKIGTEPILRGGEGANRNFGGVDYSFVPETILVTLLATAAFHGSAVLLGAPLIADASVTLLLSLLLALLAVTPLAIAVPPFQSIADGYTWLRLLSTLSPANDLEFALFAPAVGAVIGCWSGAVPIPLDWDRPWQKYPTTCIVGAIAGHATGSIVSLAIVSYRAAVRAASRALRERKSPAAEEGGQKKKKASAKGRAKIAAAASKIKNK
ncbi:hypothetical protein RHOSPDRAFT_34337 [Rhodotorula sp. JG-1b]|nr:hypothetical protein RHOSPDRAFT_34337 [Rhodotorula sp. JG-1b]